MQMRLTKLLGTLVLAAASGGFTSGAIGFAGTLSAVAQTAPSPSPGVVPVPTSPSSSPGAVPVPASPSSSPGVVPVPASPRTIGIDPAFTSQPIRLETIPEAFERAFFEESGTFYHNRTIPRQISYIIGPGLPWGAGFPDLELERDAQRINRLYRELLELQVSSDPVIRTPDLVNPFDTSLRLLSGPRRFGTRLEGSEFIYETVPPR
jgi:hypothetical protein